MDVPQSRERTGHQRVLSVHLFRALALLAAAGCSSEPVYFEGTPPTLVSGQDGDAGLPTALHLQVPYAVETAKQAEERMALADKLGLTADQVPTARRDETDLEIEWTLTNDGDDDTVAKFAVVGANEMFAYDPAAFVVDEEDDAPPPLMGGRPIDVPARSTVNGLFREDELAEAAQDLDAFTRGGVVPERALIERWKTGDVTGGMGGALAMIPSAAIPLLLALDVSVEADAPLTLTAKLRVRDKTGRVRALPTAGDVLVLPSAAAYVPPVMP